MRARIIVAWADDAAAASLRACQPPPGSLRRWLNNAGLMLFVLKDRAGTEVIQVSAVTQVARRSLRRAFGDAPSRPNPEQPRGSHAPRTPGVWGAQMKRGDQLFRRVISPLE